MNKLTALLFVFLATTIVSVILYFYSTTVISQAQILYPAGNKPTPVVKQISQLPFSGVKTKVVQSKQGIISNEKVTDPANPTGDTINKLSFKFILGDTTSVVPVQYYQSQIGVIYLRTCTTAGQCGGYSFKKVDGSTLALADLKAGDKFTLIINGDAQINGDVLTSQNPTYTLYIQREQ